MDPNVRRVTISRVPVVALATPELGQGRVLWARSGPRSHGVSLAYGEEASGDGPFVSVATHVWAQPSSLHVSSPIRTALAAERDRLFREAGIDEPEPWDGRVESLRMPLEDAGRSGRIRHEGSLWAVEVPLPMGDRPAGARPRDRAFAIVVSRGVPVPAVALRLEHDLQPFWVARDTWLHARRERSPEDLVEPLPATTDLQGIEQLVMSAVAAGAIGPHRERALAPRRSRQELRREWEVALQAQMHYGKQSQVEANRSIMLLVSQIRELSASVAWWNKAGPAAIAESIRYTVFDSEVPSRPAQLLWRTAVDEQSARADWLKEWERWNAAHAG